ncbi:MAG: serine/threonine protein kinase [Phycisphaerales bacterium]|nr:serine/threonine protein kinase [Phycisphaerales bacterium]
MLRLIAEGGFGSVWLARERVTGVMRAVKVLLKKNGDRTERDIQGVRDFQQCSHQHQHLIRILMVGETPSCFFYVMEAADNAAQLSTEAYEAMTLRRMLDRSGRLEAGAAIRIVSAIASGIAQLHRQGLAHFDLKPENVLFVEGQPKLADVGLVRSIESPSNRGGTPDYVTLEGRADDLYALGKILYELISGLPAREFPRLPRLLVSDRREQTTDAIRIANALCHPVPHRRLNDVAELLSELHRLTSSRRRFRGVWLLQPSKVRSALVAVGFVVIVLAAVAWLPSRENPAERLPERFDISLSIDDWTPLMSTPGDVGSSVQVSPSILPAIRLSGRPLMTSGVLRQELPHQVEHFSLEVRFSALRSWGKLVVGLCGRDDSSDGVRLDFRGQADGLGLVSRASALGVDGAQAEALIQGHPQPCVEYVARITNFGETLRFELWPLARNTIHPLERTIRWGDTGFRAKFLTVEADAEHFSDHLDLQSIVVTDLGETLSSATLPPPDVLANVPVRPVIQRVANRCPAPDEDLLDGDWHPHSSTLWTPIGNWSWWCQATPVAPWDIVKAVPFSTSLRVLATEDAVNGIQILRLDACEFENVKLSCHVMMPDPIVPKIETLDRGVIDSPTSTVAMAGLVIRHQDLPSENVAWGGAYLAMLCIDLNREYPDLCEIRRYDGMSMSPLSTFEIVPVGETVLARTVLTEDILPKGEIHSAGADLTLEAIGTELRLSINGRIACMANDSRFQRGRIGLFACQSPVQFQGLHCDRANLKSSDPFMRRSSPSVP